MNMHGHPPPRPPRCGESLVTGFAELLREHAEGRNQPDPEHVQRNDGDETRGNGVVDDDA